jgi:uncharacterized protein YjbI with pentapeptide repeats
MARGKRWRRQDHARGRYAPRLWAVWLVAPLWVAAAIAIAVVIYLQLRAVAVPRPGPNGGPAPRDPLDVIKTTITVAGFVGAVLVGVYGYRKQRLVEGDAHRADAEQLAQRYTTAADQLGHEKAAVRLAGVYAMARLADDWDEQRQVCIDVLCAYLRMPYEPDSASEKHREGEKDVRHTIIRLIRDHLQDPSTATTWCGHDLDFTNATFDGGTFDMAKFSGGTVSFSDAKFTGGTVSFFGAEFAGGEVSFSDAKFTGGTVSFLHAVFSGGTVCFSDAEFSGGTVSFSHAQFTGGDVFFARAKFIDGISFSGAEFAGGHVSFLDAEFSGGTALFSHAIFTGGNVDFDAKFTGGNVVFSVAEFFGGNVSFSDAIFTGDCRVAWGPFEPPAAWTELQEEELQQNERAGTMD